MHKEPNQGWWSTPVIREVRRLRSLRPSLSQPGLHETLSETNQQQKDVIAEEHEAAAHSTLPERTGFFFKLHLLAHLFWWGQGVCFPHVHVEVR